MNASASARPRCSRSLDDFLVGNRRSILGSTRCRTQGVGDPTRRTRHGCTGFRQATLVQFSEPRFV